MTPVSQIDGKAKVKLRSKALEQPPVDNRRYSPVPGGAGMDGPEGTVSTFERFLEGVPDALVGVEANGKILLANREAEELFGYTRKELLGQTLEMLVPDHFREINIGHRDGYSKDSRPRLMNADLELFARRRDGSEFPVESGLSR